MTGDDNVTTGELGRRIDALTAAVGTLSGQFAGLHMVFVTKDLWQQRNTAVDGTHTAMGREIGDLRTQVQGKASVTDLALLRADVDKRGSKTPAIVSSVAAVVSVCVAAAALLLR